MGRKSTASKIISIITMLIMLVVVFKLYGMYKKYNYTGFTKAENKQGLAKFSRDDKVKYKNTNSYKIECLDFNDAIFYKKIAVEPNTPYKLSCMIKTEGVESSDNKNGAGAQISILDTTECSRTITGTNDWQKVDFIFDSKNRKELEIGFRLGGTNANSKGTAWFSDFKLEKGTKDNTNNWNVACFLIENVDVNIDDENIKLSMSTSDIDAMKENMERFKNSANELSDGKMTVDYDVFEIQEPVKTVTFSDEFAYYLDPLDVQELIEEYLKEEEYDYIFVAVRLGDDFENIEIQVNDWIGLRGNGFKWNRIFKYKTTKQQQKLHIHI